MRRNVKCKLYTVTRLMAAVCMLPALFILPACRQAGREEPPAPAFSPAPTLSPQELRRDADKIVISELMISNHAVLRDEDGDFSDWIELENISGDRVELGGWTLSDKLGEAGWTFPDVTLEPGFRLLVFADGKDRQDILHTDFSLSAGETLVLRNSHGVQAAAVFCTGTEDDVSLCLREDGAYTESLYPTPGFPNSPAGYDAWQEQLSAPGPLIINEVVVAGLANSPVGGLGKSDWVEIKNISDSPVLLSDYYLSDSAKNYRLWQFPEQALEPGAFLLLCCDGSGTSSSGMIRTGFSLNSSQDELYLSGPDYTLIDYVSLRDIPYGCSYGRRSEENGWFFFSTPTPGRENGTGCRRVSSAPMALSADGVFNGVDSVSVELSAPGAIYYTENCNAPTADSRLYEGPIQLTGTSIIRAISVEDGALPSRPATFSYIINENHRLPVLSLVSDDVRAFNTVYSSADKYQRVRGNLALYEEDGSFSIPCEVRLYGETSLVLPKKNMAVRFRGAYGQATLNYDVFDGGVTEFTNLVLRSGQDYYNTVIRNELGLNLALQFSDNIMALRSKYCVLYTNGEYKGIYALMEKSNEQHYASIAGVDRDSVTVLEASVSTKSEMWSEVFDYCMRHDMAKPENYAYFCSVMDVDSLIDWMVFQGFAANGDLTSGNLRYCRSTDNDGKWRLMLYDLDSTFSRWNECYDNMFSPFWYARRQLSRIVEPLMKNEEFRDRFLTRAGDALSGPLTNENAVAEIDRLVEILEPEVARDFAMYGRRVSGWENNIQTLKDLFLERDWNQHCIDNLSRIFGLSQEDRAYYFGS